MQGNFNNYLKFQLLSLILVLNACQSANSIKLNGAWIGRYTVSGKDFPYPYVLNFNSDQSVQRSSLFDESSDTVKWSYTNGNLRIGNESFLVLNLDESHLTLTGGKKSRQFIRSYTQDFKDRLNEIKSRIINQKWYRKISDSDYESFQIEEVYQFTKDKMTIYRSFIYEGKNFYNEAESECYRILERDGGIFLVRLGNENTCFNSYIRVEQIVSITEKDFETRRLDGVVVENIKYDLIFADRSVSTQFNTFNVCEKQLIEPYFRLGTHYVDGKKGLSKLILQNYSNRGRFDQENGLVRFSFLVNCKGGLGNFSFQQTDLTYKPTKLDADLIYELFMLLIKFNIWIPGGADSRTFDTRKHVTFKIINGEIVEIFP